MTTKLNRLTHKIAIQLHLVAFAVVAPSVQPGNFWIHRLIRCDNVEPYLHSPKLLHGAVLS
jgi:hypothetical protein